MIGIIGAMDQELKQFINLLNEQKIVKHGNFEFIIGKVKQIEIVIIRSRIGKVAAAVATSMLLDHFLIEYVVNIGSAGGINPNNKIGDLIVGEKIFYGDVDLRAFNYSFGQMSGCPKYFSCDDKLITKLISVNKEYNLIKGDILSFDKFVTDSKSLHELVTKYFNNENLSVVEMEAASIAHTCYLFQTPVLMIKAISDIVGSNNQNLDFYQYIEIISDKLAKLLYNLL